MDEVKRLTNNCRTCAEVKPKFCKFNGSLIHATRPFERISLDFKGPLPSNSTNKYMLNAVDEFSRFPFSFPVPNLSADTVIKSLSLLFCIFGMPENIHTDRGAAFMSGELKEFLLARGITLTHSSPYNPKGNSQIERYNGVIWKTIILALKTRSLSVYEWEHVLPDALHSLQSLLCTATNQTPHDRLFAFPRRSSSGASIPDWLKHPGPVFLKRNVRHNKYEPEVDEVDLVEANPNYATVRFPSGRESNVSLGHLAPCPTSEAPPENNESSQP